VSSMNLPRQLAGLVIAIFIGLAIAVPTNLVLYVVIAFTTNWSVCLLHAIPFQSEKFFDLTGSLTFILLSVASLVLHHHASFFYPLTSSELNFNWSVQWRSTLASVFVIVWAARLGYFLFSRIQSAGVDDRFDAIRGFPLGFFSFWSVQGLWNFVTSLPVLLIHTSTNVEPNVLWTDIFGIMAWILGFIIECTADAQKTTFRNDPTKRQMFISSGLWRYSRHPNYFGEILLWVGITTMCAPVLSSWGYAFAACLSPALVIILLVFVSGIPLLERKADTKWGTHEAYQRYKEATNCLVPWFPKCKSSKKSR
jgi:steroid 5-alpha reductase family enzyme